MGNHYFCVDLNLFLFGEFSYAVDRPHNVDSGNKANLSLDEKAEIESHTELFFYITNVIKNSHKNCSYRVVNGPEPILRCVLLENSLRERNSIQHKRNYLNHIVVFKCKFPVCNISKSLVNSPAK